MKIFSLDNKIVLYLNENLESFHKIEKALRDSDNDTLLRIADEMHNVNISGVCGVYEHPGMSDDTLVEDYELNWYKSLLVEAIREDIKEKMKKDPEMGSLERREYAARSEAYSLAGRPKNVDWTKPGSIKIPDIIKQKYLLE
jgi:hypothetical protein